MAVQPLAILARSDPSAVVRAEAMEAWKAVVSGTPKK
jgi:hypothetical protein